MSIERINRQSYINVYNSNCNKAVDKIDKAKNVDRIEISNLGKSLKNYSLDRSVENSKKLSEIKKKVESGTYNVDARLTAQSLLNAMKETNE
ncbi:flagellar biosynthesis anti-sigma factor protein FlgM [Clostridium sp. DL-VIII]|uniref:flagellar biosynthesis anti-sigma factor FlgM n=1 Tax=Clostridium sp. DL-VIII TaxID=641107 RepID=UPI00023B0646|nr:flagellar biosynthesis anti-sigma factor FlgM [Clostridium sp. DL-VIII]EHJ01517.1 flagellar biosynthesis anti-sigma factor protein FlgM [Clostridium sp. DL-VIII]